LYQIGTLLKFVVMLVISTREFRDNQRIYLDKVDSGMEILIQRRKNKAYKIVSVKEDDTLMSKEAYFAMIDRGLQDIKDGKTKRYTLEELRIRMGL